MTPVDHAAATAPSGWRVAPLWSLARRVSESGHAHLPLLSVYREHGVVPRAGRDDNNNRASDDLSAYQRVQAGDLVLNKMKTWQGSLGVSAHEGIVSPAYFVCRVDPSSVHARFLHHLVRSAPYVAAYAMLSKGVRPQQWDLPWDHFRSLPVLLPPLSEQRAIAAFLDAQVALLDRAISLRERQGDLERERFSAVREATVEVEGLRHVPLGLLVEQGRPINYGVLMPGNRLASGIPLIEAGDVMRGPISLDDLRLTDPVIELEFARSRLRAGDLVMAIRGSVGGVQIVPSGPALMNVTRDAARISLRSDQAQAAFVRHALSTRRVQEWLALRLTGSAVKGINIAELRKVPVALPDLRAQAEMAERLDAAESYLRKAQALLANGRSLLMERKQALVTAAVTGQFDVATARSAA